MAKRIKSSKDVERTPFEKLIRKIKFKTRPRNIISYLYLIIFRVILRNPTIRVNLS